MKYKLAQWKKEAEHKFKKIRYESPRQTSYPNKLEKSNKNTLT